MQSRVIIRPLEPADIPAVIALWQEVGDFHEEMDGPSILRRKAERDPGLFLVAEEDDRIVGTVMGGFDGRMGTVGRLAVAKGRRREGVARQLMRELEGRLGEKGAAAVSLLVEQENDAAIPLYLDMGYARFEDVLYMRKLLARPAAKRNISMARKSAEIRPEGFTAQEVAAYWDHNADQWTSQVRQGWDASREHFNTPLFLKFIGEVAGRTMLDAGCGEGRNTRILARLGARMIGVDISSRMIEYARQREEETGLGIRYEQTSYSDLSLFADASFDRAVSTMALMDGPDYAGALAEILRVLRPGGDFCFSVLHPCFMTRGFSWLLDEQGERSKVTVSGYFDDRPWVDEWKFSAAWGLEEIGPFAVPNFPRTLSDYVNGLIQAGFVLNKIEEARPTEAMVHEIPRLRSWREHVSNFIYFQAVKS